MAIIMSDFTSFWYSDDMEEQVAVADGEFILLSTNTRKVEKLGSTFAEAKETLTVLGKIENFSDFL